MAGNVSSAGSEPGIDYADLFDALYWFTYSRVRDRHIAEDLTQEVFLRATRSWNSLRNRDRISAWLFGIARNVVADHFRKARPTIHFDEALHGNGDQEEHGVPGKEEEYLRRQLTAYVRSVVENLPPLYRDALMLTEYEGLTQVELARRAGISVSAAKSRVQRAREKVRRKIEACCQFQTDAYGAVVDCRSRINGKSCPD